MPCTTCTWTRQAGADRWQRLGVVAVSLARGPNGALPAVPPPSTNLTASCASGNAVIDACVSTVAWWALGFAFSIGGCGESGFIGAWVLAWHGMGPAHSLSLPCHASLQLVCSLPVNAACCASQATTACSHRLITGYMRAPCRTRRLPPLLRDQPLLPHLLGLLDVWLGVQRHIGHGCERRHGRARQVQVGLLA